jgi:threonine/homoserine/homoserine lactone efflux protein
VEPLIAGLSLGLAAGLAPGPLHLLVLTTALQRGFAAGVRVAIAPLLTDLPVVAAGVAAAGTLPEGVVRLMAGAGGLFVVYLGVDAFRQRTAEAGAERVPARQDVGRGFVTNLLSPIRGCSGWASGDRCWWRPGESRRSEASSS